MSKLYFIILVLFLTSAHASASLYIADPDTFTSASIIPFYNYGDSLSVILYGKLSSNKSLSMTSIVFNYSDFSYLKKFNENSWECALRGFSKKVMLTEAKLNDQKFFNIKPYDVCSSYVVEKDDESKHVVYFVNYASYANLLLENFFQKANEESGKKIVVVPWIDLVNAIKANRTSVNGIMKDGNTNVPERNIELQLDFIKSVQSFLNNEAANRIFYDNSLTSSIKKFVTENKNNFFINNLIGQQKFLTVTVLTTFLIYFFYKMNTMYNFV